MKTETCPHCQKFFSHETEKAAKFALAMHLSHQHGIRSERAEHIRKLKKAREARKKAAESGSEQTKPVEKPKRAYVRRAVKQQEAGPMVRFCPCCGCNLHAVAVAIRLQG